MLLEDRQLGRVRLLVVGAVRHQRDHLVRRIGAQFHGVVDQYRGDQRVGRGRRAEHDAGIGIDARHRHPRRVILQTEDVAPLPDQAAHLQRRHRHVRTGVREIVDRRLDVIGGHHGHAERDGGRMLAGRGHVRLLECLVAARLVAVTEREHTDVARQRAFAEIDVEVRAHAGHVGHDLLVGELTVQRHLLAQLGELLVGHLVMMMRVLLPTGGQRERGQCADQDQRSKRAGCLPPNHGRASVVVLTDSTPPHRRPVTPIVTVRHPPRETSCRCSRGLRGTASSAPRGRGA